MGVRAPGATLVVSILGYSEGEQDGVVAESEASVADLLQMCVLSNGKYFPMALFQHRSGGRNDSEWERGYKNTRLGGDEIKGKLRSPCCFRGTGNY